MGWVTGWYLLGYLVIDLIEGGEGLCRSVGVSALASDRARPISKTERSGPRLRPRGRGQPEGARATPPRRGATSWSPSSVQYRSSSKHARANHFAGSMTSASNAAIMAKMESQVLAEYAAVAANLDHVSRACCFPQI